MCNHSVLVWVAPAVWGRGTQPLSRPLGGSSWRRRSWSLWSLTWTGWSHPGPPTTTTTLLAGTSMITSDVILTRVLTPSSWWSLVIWGWALRDLEPLMKVPRHKTWKIVVYCLPSWSSTQYFWEQKTKWLLALSRKISLKFRQSFLQDLSYILLSIFYLSSPHVGTLSNIFSKYCENFVINVGVPGLFYSLYKSQY